MRTGFRKALLCADRIQAACKRRGGAVGMGVRWSKPRLPSPKPLPDYSIHRCSRTEELSNPGIPRKQFSVRRKVPDPDAAHHRVRLRVISQYTQSLQCKGRLDVGGGSDTPQAASRESPATVCARPASCRCAAIARCWFVGVLCVSCRSTSPPPILTVPRLALQGQAIRPAQRMRCEIPSSSPCKGEGTRSLSPDVLPSSTTPASASPETRARPLSPHLNCEYPRSAPPCPRSLHRSAARRPYPAPDALPPSPHSDCSTPAP